MSKPLPAVLTRSLTWLCVYFHQPGMGPQPIEVAVVSTLAVVVPAMFVAGTLADGVRLGVGLAVGSAVASVAYCAIFVAISLLSARPTLVGLAYILLWEGTLTGFINGTAVFSVTQYGVAIADSVAGSDLINGRLNVAVAGSLATRYVLDGPSCVVCIVCLRPQCSLTSAVVTLIVEIFSPGRKCRVRLSRHRGDPCDLPARITTVHPGLPRRPCVDLRSAPRERCFYKCNSYDSNLNDAGA